MISERPIPMPALTAHLPFKTWTRRQQRHKNEVDTVLTPYLQKKQQQHNDPVLDFLFEYYAFRPSHLQRWSPGINTMLQGAHKRNAPELHELEFTGEGGWLNPHYFPENRKRAARWMCQMLQQSLEKPPSFGCFGMHEWAMVYRAENVRHSHLPLRMSKEKLAAFVESRPLVCTHFDAFRFFTDDAKPMNRFNLSRQNFEETEQAGCLHTNMDLYKWAFKLFPWISSRIIRKAFFLALKTRRFDMQASPYDLRKRGLQPIKIETEAGRLEYVRRQRHIYRQSQPVRKALIDEYKQLISHF